MSYKINTQLQLCNVKIENTVGTRAKWRTEKKTNKIIIHSKLTEIVSEECFEFSSEYEIS